MERGHRGEAAPEREEAWVGEEEEEEEEGWGEHEREQAPGEIASAPVAERGFHIKWELPATT